MKHLLVILTVFALVNPMIARSAATDPALTPHQREVISYFKEVALGFEYGAASGTTRKWTAPMKVYLAGHPTAALSAEVVKVKDELNSLITDGFHIEIVNDQAQANMVMFFGSRDEFSAIYPRDKETVKTSSGIFRIYYNKSNVITRGYIFIHTVGISEKEQRHAIREELTQSLGLGKDSPLYKTSIFQSDWVLVTEYSDLDRDLIKLLYHPRMKVGLTAETIDAVLTEILLSEPQTL